MFLIAAGLGKELQAAGDRLKDARLRDYRGWRVGSLYWGERDDGVIVQITGGYSDVLLHEFVNLPEAHITRFDEQVTRKLDLPVLDGYLSQLRDAALVARQAFAARGRPVAIELRDTHGRGNTLTIGVRESEAYARVYDKHKQSPKLYAPGSGRWEVEYKGSKAVAVYERTKQSISNRTYGKALLASVVGWFADKGVAVPASNVEAVEPVRTVKHVTDKEKTMAWVRSTVRGAYARAVAEGWGDEFLRAMGAGQLASTPEPGKSALASLLRVKSL
jgi:hypothetical protein